MTTTAEEARLRIDDATEVGALTMRPVEARAAYVFAHGAGAGMRHAFMAAFAEGLAARGIATFRFQFPFIEKGSRRPDTPAVAHAAVRSACEAASHAWPELPLFAGGKSFGGRMTSQAEAAGLLPPLAGLVFVGFPLHPPERPSAARSDHLAGVERPMLFLQGTRDELAQSALVADVVARLGRLATLASFDDADHAFHVRRKSGSTDEATRDAMLDTMVAWMERVGAA